MPNGKPAPFVRLRLEPGAAGGTLQWTSTDSSGYYEFLGGILGGNFNIEVDAPGFRPIRRFIMVTTYAMEEDFALEWPPAAPLNPGGLVSVDQLKIPPKAKAQYDRGIRSLEAENFAAAISNFRKAVRIYPRYAAGFRQLGAAYASQGRFPDADEAIQNALQLEHDNAEDYAYLGYIDVKEKKLDKAEEAFQKSLAISKDNWFAQLGLGGLRYSQRNYQNALTHLAIAHKLHPEALSVHLLFYDDLIRLNKKKEALAELDDILAHFPNCAEAPKLRKIRPALAASAARQQP